MNMEPTYIPEGRYLTKTQIAERFSVIPETVQQWIQKGWVPTIQIPGLGHIINERDIENFSPPKPGPRRNSSS